MRARNNKKPEMLQAIQRQPTTQRQPAPRTSLQPPATVPPAPRSSAAPRNSLDLASDAIRETQSAANRERQQAQRLADMERTAARQDLEKQAIRRWKVGDVYAPHDLTGVEIGKWKKLRRKGKLKSDVVDLLGINPIEHYKNFSMMSEYMTEMGRIKHSNETSLRPVNQRRMAKAIRRAIGCGLMPGIHRHPEVLRHQADNRTRLR